MTTNPSYPDNSSPWMRPGSSQPQPEYGAPAYPGNPAPTYNYPPYTQAPNGYPVTPNMPYAAYNHVAAANKKNLLRRPGALIALGSVAAAGIVGTVIGIGSTLHSDKEGSAPNSGADRVATSGVLPEQQASAIPDSATKEQFNDDYTDQQREAWADAELKKPSTDADYPGMTVEQAALKRYNANLVAQGHPAIQQELTDASSSDNAADVQTHAAAVLAAAIYNPDVVHGEKLLGAAFSGKYSTSPYQRDQALVENDHTMTDSDRLSQAPINWYVAVHRDSSGNIVPVSTGLTSDKPLGGVSPSDYGNQPTRVAELIDSTQEHANEEQVQVLTNNRFIITDEFSQIGESARWTPPEELPSLPR